MEFPRRHARPSESAAELLTSLPAHLLDRILNHLDLRDTVRTSALSRAWRRRWEALPYLSLSFLDNPGTPPVIIDSVLLRYPGHISHFSFLLEEHSVGRVADWLIAVCNRGVESINLQHSSPMTEDVFPYGFALHSSVFSCTQLVHLELHYCRIPPLPVGFIGFPVLEELKLHIVKFPENGESQLEAILSGSPLLNTLNLSSVDICGDGSNEWVVGGPNLRNLTINSFAYYGWRITDLPCLDEATIDLGNYVSSGFEGYIAGFAQVRKLILHTHYPLPLLSNGHLMETLPCTFNNLKSLNLRTHFCERPAIFSTFCLLMNAPNLEELYITIDRDDEDEFEANAVYPNTQLTDAFCANLHIVKIDGIGWLPNEMCFIELVLSKAIVLLTMHLTLGYISSISNEDALCELMTYRRASPHAQMTQNKLFNGDVSFAPCWE